jgi:hypothetical protein
MAARVLGMLHEQHSSWSSMELASFIALDRKEHSDTYVKT